MPKTKQKPTQANHQSSSSTHEDGTIFPTLKFNKEFIARHSEFLNNSYDDLSSNLNQKLSEELNYYEINCKLLNFLKGKATTPDKVWFPCDTNFLATLFALNIDNFLLAQTSGIPNDMQIDNEQTNDAYKKMNYFIAYYKPEKESHEHEEEIHEHEEEIHEHEEENNEHEETAKLDIHDEEDEMLEVHENDIGPGNSDMHGNEQHDEIKPINKIFLVLPAWNMLTPLLDSFQKKLILKEFDITFEIDRQENIFEDPDSIFTICKARHELEKNCYNQSLISCQNICPFKTDFANSFQSQNSKLDLNQIEDIEDLFINDDRCPVLELQNYNKIKNETEKASPKTKIVITSSISLIIYLFRKEIFDGFDLFPRFFKENRVIFLGDKFDNNILNEIYTIQIHLDKCAKLFTKMKATLDNDIEANQRFINVITTALRHLNMFMLDNNFAIPSIRSNPHFKEDEFLQTFNSLSLKYQYSIHQILHLVFSIRLPKNHFVLTENFPLVTFNLSANIDKYLNSFLSFTLSPKYPTQASDKLRGFLSMLSSKENNKLSFYSSSDVSQDNGFGSNIIKADFGDMYGIRILSWYPVFFKKVLDYLSITRTKLVNQIKYLHLTGSPGIGKSTFIYYFVLRWIKLAELDLTSWHFFGINLIYIDQTIKENVLILKLDQDIFLCNSNEIINSTKTAIIFSQSEYLYHIVENKVMLINSNFKAKYNNFIISATFSEKSIKIKITKPQGKEYEIFSILDGATTAKSEYKLFSKGLLCTSYRHEIIRNKYYITYVAPTCTINEFMNTLLLYNGGNKKRMLEMAQTIVRYIHLNIRDALHFADDYTYISPDEFLMNLIDSQFSQTNDAHEYNGLDYLNNKKFAFIICPENNSLELYRLVHFKFMKHFTSNISRDIVLSNIKGNTLVNNVEIINLLRTILNVDDPKIKGILFESYGHLELKNPCVLDAYSVTISENARSILYGPKTHLCINFCALVEIIDDVDSQIDDFVSQLLKPKENTNYVFRPPYYYQPLYDALVYDFHHKYLYVIQMTVSPKSEFVGDEFKKIFDAFHKKKVKIQKMIYVHLRNYPLNEKRGFLTGKGKKSALKCIKTYHHIEIYYTTLNIQLTTKIRSFYQQIEENTLKQKNKLMIDKINHLESL
ncbi:hypothetical protein TRFO_04136 [Tritrichomonas foetus]|uniref:Uncharacterized protein n=1 Tax=Tritrichomonas foetus TaxID=1144522 RepID=A0A1J4KH20_9EUKA|nr:hypothetical protein TRFO_04136 [Tritrichomonas foetus]|eukprot:OHT10641.1 hypothetical protein TRFO_04136 [Tritrichomonas foetus]